MSEKATTVVESCKGATAKGQIETDDPYSPEQARVHYFGGSKGTFELRTEGTFESPPLWLEAKYTFVLEIDNFDVVDPRREVDKLLDGTDLGVFRASRRTVRVTGKLQAKGAAQLNDVQIEYEGTSHGTQLPNGTATTDEHGVFEVKLFEGGQYTFTPQPPEHHEFVGEPVVIHSLEKGQSQLEFVLAR
ncbi:MAG: hypothetical protein K0V04_42850, partial [Deltaproteobacteria bacterium]|nr:hypothetical protein [Deltaproteobacteria bacterium]